VGGGFVGCEIAYTLASEKDVEVTVIEMLDNLMEGVFHANRSMLLWMMMGQGSPSDKSADRLARPVKAYASSKVFKVEEGKIHFRANRKRKDPFTPWTTLLPDALPPNPLERKLNPRNTEDLAIDTDFIIFATGVREDNALYYELLQKARDTEIFCVGDARQTARGWEAITAANDIARFI
ncbi:MAG: NAD-binding protein, partial [Deltaproteobacteria bacterium]|nr:NAD-binding protein [Deltaproteobacteria bacterium]